jgi:hypothetical protein
MKRAPTGVASFLVLAVIFSIGCVFASFLPVAWTYLFGSGLLLGALAAADYSENRTWRLPVLLCVATGLLTGPTIKEYPVVEVLGLYVAISILIAASTWWWKAPRLSSE